MIIRSIPPITSTGRNRRQTSVPRNGLAYMSIGRYMSEMANNRRNENDHESWDISKYAKSDLNRKSNRKVTKPIRYDIDQKIDCITDMRDDYYPEGDFVISLRFTGIEFMSDVVTTFSDKLKRRSFLVPVFYKNSVKESFLLLTTVGDIFEYEVVNDISQCYIEECFMGHSKKGTTMNGEKEFCTNRLYRNEAYIPQLLHTYNSESMHVVIKDNCVLVTYQKK